ncbi:MAG: PHP domain-containing protein [Pseudomonadota bacterium]
MSYRYDLHTHSRCSDGKLTPTALVDLAAANGVDVLAVTDHDTVAGVAEAMQAADGRMQIISGIEFSALWRGYNIHIVGLKIDIHSPGLINAIKQQQSSRLSRARTIAERLEKSGIVGAWEGAQHYADGPSIGRPHFAQYLVDSAYVSSFAEAFSRYLGAGKVGDVKQLWPAIETVIAWIRDSQGLAVLAHPDKYDMTRTKLYTLLDDFVEAGGEAIELVSGNQTPPVTEKLLRAANHFRLYGRYSRKKVYLDYV